jgi:hypothetical protein
MALLPLSSATEDHNKLTQHFSERELDAESSVKPGDKNEDTLRINRGAIRVPSPNPSLISIDDWNNIRLGRNPDYDPVYHERFVSRSPAPPRTIKGRIQAFWKSNKGLALVLISQLFGTLMNVTTRMLEMEGNDGGPTREDAMISQADTFTGKGYHPFQILFARMGITVMCASFYMWYKKTEHFPFGMREVRSLLIARGLTGFFGVFGMYCKFPTMVHGAYDDTVTCQSSLKTGCFDSCHNGCLTCWDSQ